MFLEKCIYLVAGKYGKMAVKVEIDMTNRVFFIFLINIFNKLKI